MKESDLGRMIFSYIGEFILGGVALLAIAIAYWSIRELKKAHEKHVDDLKSANKELIESQKDSRASDATVVGAMEALTTTVGAQTTAITHNTRANTDVKSAIDGLKSVVDSVLRDAVRNQARPSAVDHSSGNG